MICTVVAMPISLVKEKVLGEIIGEASTHRQGIGSVSPLSVNKIAAIDVRHFPGDPVSRHEVQDGFRDVLALPWA